MNSLFINNILRFVLLFIFQVLIFKRLSMGWSGAYYFHALLYPLAIALLPSITPRVVQLLLAFALGLSVDAFYDSPGLHASAAVFTAYIRPYLFRYIAPYEGYKLGFVPLPSQLGLNWFARYIGLLFTAHLFFYFSVEAFTFVFITSILLKTVLSLLVSVPIALMLVLIFNPKE